MMMKKLIAAVFMFLAAPLHAQAWTVGQQPVNYTNAHPIGDGVTNPRGGEAPYFSSEPNDISSPAVDIVSFPGTISGTTLTITGAITGTITAGEPVSGAGLSSTVTLSSCSGTPPTSCTLSAAQNASFTATINNGGAAAGNILTTSGVTGPINIGAVVSGTGVPANTIVLQNIDSTHWIVSTTSNIASEAMTSAPPAGTFTSGWVMSCPVVNVCGGNSVSTGEYLPQTATFTGRIDNGTPGTAGNILTFPSGTYVAPGGFLVGTGIPTGTSEPVVIYCITAPTPPSSACGGTQAVVTTSASGLNIASETITEGRSDAEAKSRFDCNDTFDEKSDPILKPGQSGTNSHDHHFFGNMAAQGNMASVNYAYLRQNGNTTCYGGPLNRTLYWEPTLFTKSNGLTLSIRATSITTYYNVGTLDPNWTATFTRWPRTLAMIFGFDFNDPNNMRLRNHISATSGLTNPAKVFSQQNAQVQGNGFFGWYCAYWATPSYTAYAPNQSQGAPQPYLNDGNGHATMNCQDNTTAGHSTDNNLPHGVQVYAVLNGPDCWDGQNPQSPNGRDHLNYFVVFQNGTESCPDNWYRIPNFEPKIFFELSSATEMGAVWLSSDKMPGMNLASFTASISGTTLTVSDPTGANLLRDISNHLITGGGIPAGTSIVLNSCTTNAQGQETACTLSANLGTISAETVTIPYNGGETMHADLFAAWDYGTGDHPGTMVNWFQHCNGISMHLKNSDGVTYTDLVGDPHECAFARAGPNMQLYNTIAPPDGSTPNPVVNLNPNMVGTNRYFPVANGTPLTGSVLHTH